MITKLYVVTRGDLSPAQQAVQAGHALAEYLLSTESEWDNGTLVYLKVPDLKELECLMSNLSYRGIHFKEFREPMFNNEATALASLGNNSLFRKLSML